MIRLQRGSSATPASRSGSFFRQPRTAIHNTPAQRVGVYRGTDSAEPESSGDTCPNSGPTPQKRDPPYDAAAACVAQTRKLADIRAGCRNAAFLLDDPQTVDRSRLPSHCFLVAW
jgi:hypothetical protein